MSLPLNQLNVRSVSELSSKPAYNDVLRTPLQIDRHFLDLLPALTLPVIDRLGYTLQILKLRGYGMIGLVTDPAGIKIVIGKHKISSPLCPGMTPDSLMSKIERAVGAVWDLVYKSGSCELIVFPHLDAAGKRFQIGPIRQLKPDNLPSQFYPGNPLSHFNRDELRQRYLSKGYVLHHTHKTDKADFETYTNGKFWHNIDYKNSYGEIPHVDVYRERDHPSYRNHPPGPSFNRKEGEQLKARFAIKPDSPAEKQFHEIVHKTGLERSFNSTHPEKPIPEKKGASGEIGGVGSIGDYIEGLFDAPESLFDTEHAFFIPQMNGEDIPFSEGELHQMLNELALGIYIHDTVPFFSLHFNEDGNLYPVIHPVYEKTLVGQVFSMLDYMMKGYLNGGVFKELFVYSWSENPFEMQPNEQIIDQMINFENYAKENLHGSDKEYSSLAKLLSKFEINDFFGYLNEKMTELKDKLLLNKIPEDPILKDYTKFNNSFRIIAFQKRIQKQDNLFVLNSDFKVEYTIDPNPDYKLALERHRKIHGGDPKAYEFLEKSYELFSQRIHDHFVKFPICRKYFSMLGVINFFSLYFKTLKRHGKYPLLPSHSIQPLGCPPLFPPLPILSTRKEKLSLNFRKLTENIKVGFRPALFDLLLQDEKLSEEAEKTINAGVNKEISRQIFEAASEIFKRKMRLDPSELEKISRDLQKEIAFCARFKKRYAQTVEAYKNTNGNWLYEWYKDKIKTHYVNVGCTTIFKEEPFEFSRDVSLFVLPSEQAESEKEKGRKVVGGCGMTMPKLKIEELPCGRDILDLVSLKLDQNPSTSWVIVKQEDLGGLKGAVFNLPFMDIPFSNSENTDKMEQLLLTPAQGPSLSLFKMKSMLRAMAFGDQEKFAEALIGADVMTLVDLEGQHILHHAVRNPDIIYTKKLLEAGIAVRLADRNGNTALHHAAMGGSVDQMELLIGHDSDLIKMKNRYGATALFVAVQNEQKRAVEFLLEKGASLQGRLVDGYTIFHCAALTGNNAIMTVLLKRMYEPSAKLKKESISQLQSHLNKTTQEGITPLMIAVGNGLDIVKSLVEAQVNVNLKAKNGKTALDIAIDHNHIEICRYLIPLSKLSDFTIEKAIRKGKLDLNRSLTQIPGYLDFRNNVGDSPLLIALRYANVSFALVLIDMIPDGGTLGHQNLLGDTAIALAARGGFYDIVEKFLLRGVSIDRVTLLAHLLQSGYEGDYESIQTYVNSIHYSQQDLQKLILVAANAGNHVGISRCLIPLDADLSLFVGPDGWRIEHFLARSDGIYLLRRRLQTNPDPLMPLQSDGGRTLLYIAAQNGNSKVLSYLLDYALANRISLDRHYLDRHLLCGVIESGNLNIIRLFIDKVKDPDLLNLPLDDSGRRAIHVAAKKGLIDVVTYLYQNGADRKALDRDGRSALFYAIESKKKECVDFIIKNEKNLEISAEDLYMAAAKGMNPFLQALILAGADIDQRSTVNGMTPLMLAIEANDYAAFSLLLECHPLLTLKNPAGWTPLLLASKHSNLPMLEKILMRLPQEAWLDRVNGDNALHIAVRNQSGECIEFLLNNGFPTEEKNGQGKTALYLGEGIATLAALGKQAESKMYQEIKNLIIVSIELQMLNILEKMIDQLPLNTYFSIHIKGMKSRGTLLHLILEHCTRTTGLKEMVSRLCSMPDFDPSLKNGSGLSYGHLMVAAKIDPTTFDNISLVEVDNNGRNLLHLAAELDDKLILKMLIRVNGKSILENLINKFGIAKANEPDNMGRTPLFYAISADRRENIKTLCKMGVDLNVADHLMRTPLCIACIKKNFRVVKMLIKYGANVNGKNSNESINLLEITMELKLEEIALYLLYSGVDVKRKFSKGSHLVHLAAAAGKQSFIRFMAARGISIDAHDEKGAQPIHYAAITGKTKVLEELISYGIDIETKTLQIKKNPNGSDPKPMTPLALAASNSTDKTVRWLLEHGATPEGGDKEKINILLNALANDPVKSEQIIKCFTEYRLIDDLKNIVPAVIRSIVKDYVGPLKIFLGMGISVDTDLMGGNTPLHVACQQGAFHCTHFLLEQGADATLRNADGKTPLELAAGNKSAEQFLVMLRQVNCHPDIPNQKGETLLHIATASGNLSHVALLLEFGADYNIQDVMGKTPLFLGAESGYEEIVDLLMLCGADPMLSTTFNSSFPHDVGKQKIRERINFLKEMIETAVPGSTLLHNAALHGSRLALTLIAAHVDVNQRNARGSTALHEAVRSNNRDRIRELIRQGVDVNVEDHEGTTPLAIACFELRNKTIAKLLLNSGAQAHHVGKGGKSILEIVSQDLELMGILEIFSKKG